MAIPVIDNKCIIMTSLRNVYFSILAEILPPLIFIFVFYAPAGAKIRKKRKNKNKRGGAVICAPRSIQGIVPTVLMAIK